MTDAGALAKQLLAAHDKDNNGLDLTEFNNVFADASFQAHVNVAGHSAEALFKQFDSDGNGLLGEDELVTLLNDATLKK